MRRFETCHLKYAVTAALLATAAMSTDVIAQDAKQNAPQILMGVPLAVAPGAKTKIILRGLRLAKATEVRVASGTATAKLVGQGAATKPDKQDVKLVGDTQAEIELDVPAEPAAVTIGLTVVSPDGESNAYELLVGGEYPVLAEIEPNDGFRQAQAIAVPQVVDGSIHVNGNVDVFVFEGVAGETLVCETLTSRRGSAMDPVLSLYDARGNLVAQSDDTEGTRDARITVKLPATDKYWISLADAHNQGGPAHPYRLVVKKQ